MFKIFQILRRKLKLWELSQCCPMFWENFPKTDDPGPWVAVAMTATLRGTQEKVRHLVNDGKQTAYIVAREIALDLDSCTPYCNGDIGIEYALRKPIEGEVYDNIPLTTQSK